MEKGAEAGKRGFRLWDMTPYHWLVVFAAWLGWGFDVFDSLLFNFVAPNAVPTLLGIPLGTEEARKASLEWTGILSSVLLIGWAVGGILFGRICDRIGRIRTLLLTMLLYAAGTAACAFATNIWMLLAFRIVASLGIGGEWAAGAAMVAEVVPEKRRVEAGALLYTSAPLGLFLANYVAHWIQGGIMSGQPEVAWRYVFLVGLAPAFVAVLVRVFLKEPERWQAAAKAGQTRLAELFSDEHRRATLSGFAMALVCLLMWWSCNAFIPVIANGLAQVHAAAQNFAPDAARALANQWQKDAANWFNLGGLIGTLLTVPIAKTLGRKPMFVLYFVMSAVAIYLTFGLATDPLTKLRLYFLLGISVFGVFGSFTYYLPELFPTRLRGTGAGFCYNAGRIFASAGPFLVGAIAASGPDSLRLAQGVLVWVAVVPLVGLAMMPWVVETKGRELLG